MRSFEKLKIAVAGTGYVGLSIAILLAQHHQVIAVDVIPEKVDLIVSIRPRACFSPSYNKVKSQTKHVWLLTLL